METRRERDADWRFIVGALAMERRFAWMISDDPLADDSWRLDSVERGGHRVSVAYDNTHFPA
jgi:hypothetical protein